MSNSLNTPLRQHREGTPTSVLGGPSPHYVAGKRYALYGNEDRVVLDVGCKFIKFGFSSEATPRGVLDLITCGAPARGLWALRTRWDSQTAKEVKIILQKALRRILQLELMLDARTRKVVFVEHPLWPRQIKGILAGILFDNLQVPSISSVPTHLSALLASGVTTGLVVDLGHLETVLLPVFAARPLYLNLESSTCAGERILQRLRALLLSFGRYAPPAPLSVTSTSSSGPDFQDVPPEVLTPAVLLDLLHQALYVSPHVPDRSALHQQSPIDAQDVPVLEGQGYEEAEDMRWMRRLESCYQSQSTATSLTVRVPPAQPPAMGQPNVKGLLLVPGWVREHAADVLFEEGDEDEPSLLQITMLVLLKLPIDLRKTMCSQLLLTGGLSMLPGLFTRFRRELTRALRACRSPQTSPSEAPSARKPTRVSPLIPKRTSSTRFAPIVALHQHVAILNDPCLAGTESRGEEEADVLHPNSGSAPGFSPSLLPWIGGSLSVALKTNGAEVTKEQWADSRRSHGHSRPGDSGGSSTGVEYWMPDWSMPSLAEPKGSK